MVFQSYALYPHMSVRKQHRLRPARWRACPRARSTRRSPTPRAILNLTDYLDRKPRPALRRPAPARRHRPRHRARAEGLPVRRAAVEPRRGAARQDAARDRASSTSTLGTTMIYVTHDQVEAMTMADQHRRAQHGQDRAGRHAARTLQQPGQPVRRRLHRLAEDEPDRRPTGSEPSTPRPSASGPSISASRATAGHGGARSASPSISAPTPSSMFTSTGVGDAHRPGARRVRARSRATRSGLTPEAGRIHRFGEDGKALTA